MRLLPETGLRLAVGRTLPRYAGTNATGTAFVEAATHCADAIETGSGMVAAIRLVFSALLSTTEAREGLE